MKAEQIAKEIYDSCLELDINGNCRATYEGVLEIVKIILSGKNIKERLNEIGDEIIREEEKECKKEYEAMLAKDKRHSLEYREWRMKILDKHGHKCKICGSTERLEVHHIKPVLEYPEAIFDMDNGIVLCKSCHIQQHLP